LKDSARMAFAAVIALVLCSGCSDEFNNSILEEGPGMEQGGGDRTVAVFPLDDEILTFRQRALNLDRSAFFGDLHVHTKYSFDAYAIGTLASPHDAYRFAKGEAIKHPAGFDIQLK